MQGRINGESHRGLGRDDAVTDVAQRVRLSEIFTSIEGEGLLFGTKTLFVRLAGCPLKCYWCDTPYALLSEAGQDCSINEAKTLISESLAPNTYKINFTGGEPLIQYEAVIELAKFAKKELGLRTYLESACYDSVRFSHVLPFIDLCKVEFKMKDSRVVDPRHYETLIGNELQCLEISTSRSNENRDRLTYLKVVVTNSTSLVEFRELVDRIFALKHTNRIAGFIIQPSSSVDEPTLDRLLQFYDIVYPFYGQVRIVPQLHKKIGAR